MSYGLPFSQRVLLALIDTGMNRQEAYKIVQRNAMVSWKERRTFQSVLDSDADVTNRLDGVRLRELFDYAYYTTSVDDSFRRLGLA
jgi:adenylosuccinate lyase